MTQHAEVAPITFGPFYPEPLQQSVIHAERLAAVLAGHQNARERETPRAGARREPAGHEVWLIGRASELETFVADVLDDWRRGVVSAFTARELLDAYLEDMHCGLRAWVTGGVAPGCCAAEPATQLGFVDEIVTSISPRGNPIVLRKRR